MTLRPGGHSGGTASTMTSKIKGSLSPDPSVNPKSGKVSGKTKVADISTTPSGPMTSPFPIPVSGPRRDD
ncbi:MAG: hypothetical protein V3T23_13820 [Nitrososphaerales archaeon]